jgi:rhamnose utilization protein RhaD (predicted bifunctional aldolase and dehydrogenase)/NAD(P)-dependent dehydrogenase (short-subunit alcohol dehydrogenase family)
VSREWSTARALPPEPVEEIDELLGVSHRFGLDTTFSRAGGGNSSVKVDGVLYIKPSGVPLADLTREALVPLDMAPLLALLEEAPGDGGAPGSDPVMRVAQAARLAEAGGRRPSVELLFHALLPQRYVLHTHPVVINAVTCNRDGAELCQRLFGDDVLWVPYIDPGLPLARLIAERRREYQGRVGAPPPRVTLLQNHGIIVTGDRASEIDELSAWLVATVQEAMQGAAAGDPGAGPLASLPEPFDPARARALVDAIGPTLRGLLGTGDRLKVVTFDATRLAARFTATEGGRAFVLGGPLYPDHIVYAGSWPLLLDLAPDVDPAEVPSTLRVRLDEHVAAHGGPPIIVVVPGLGLFAAGDSWAGADTARHIELDALRVAEGALALGAVHPLSDSQRTYIETWEAEAYRIGIAAGRRTGGRFAGRVAVVTGAAQGFGHAIAADLVAEGGHVVLADVNAALAEANARELEAGSAPGRATAVVMDVTDERSVSDGLHAVVERYGGFDLLVSNAGVLRAGGVDTQPIDEFDLVTRVNYRGYFLGVRFAAPILARQHRARPAWLGDIIEINSKSGLVGSSRNSAYAGSKFGGVGLTQSFALELVGDGIKVNAICPGNFFDGPLWSDPVNGLFQQYLREGKVQGATTIDDVRRAYEAKVPMGRGCVPADVLEALYYLVRQRYETGQALPVTGGQVMLS